MADPQQSSSADKTDRAAQLTPAMRQYQQFKAQYPGFYVVQNPVDVTGSATSHDYRVGIEALLDDPNVDLVMPWFVFQDTPLDEGIVNALGELSDRRTKPIVCGGMGGPYTVAISKQIEARGVPIFPTVREWMAAVHALAFRAVYPHD